MIYTHEKKCGIRIETYVKGNSKPCLGYETILKNNQTTYNSCINPLRPSDAVRKPKNLFQRTFLVQYCQNFKKYISPSVNLKFSNLGIFQSSRLRNLMGKILSISLKLNFTPNTYFGLLWVNLTPKTSNSQKQKFRFYCVFLEWVCSFW